MLVNNFFKLKSVSKNEIFNEKQKNYMNTRKQFLIEKKIKIDSEIQEKRIGDKLDKAIMIIEGDSPLDYAALKIGQSILKSMNPPLSKRRKQKLKDLEKNMNEVAKKKVEEKYKDFFNESEKKHKILEEKCEKISIDNKKKDKDKIKKIIINLSFKEGIKFIDYIIQEILSLPDANGNFINKEYYLKIKAEALLFYTDDKPSERYHADSDFKRNLNIRMSLII